MARCDLCGNDYDKAFTVVMSGGPYTFDSFECAIQKLAPTCAHCGCRIIGHGVEQGDGDLLLLRALRPEVRSGRRARQRGRPASIDPGR